jgi:hypothetical protein
MGRQIHFVHTEENINDILTFIEQEGGYFLWDNCAQKPKNLINDIIAQMGTSSSTYAIVVSSHLGNIANPNSAYTSGAAIEFSNCCKGNPYSRTYEVGRIYITQSNEGVYDEELNALYKKIYTYIRRNYIYSTKAKIYYSKEFAYYYNRQYFYVTRAGWRLTL